MRHYSRISAGMSAGLSLLLVFMLPGGASAQQSEPDPQYHVEIIVFENIDGSRSEEDFFHDLTRTTPAPPLKRLPLPDLQLDPIAEPAPAANQSVPPLAGSATTFAAEQAPLSPVDSLVPFELPVTASAEMIARLPPLPDGFRVLQTEELELGDVRAEIYRRREYRVLGHTGWVQTGVSENQAVGIDMNVLGITNPAGDITVYLGRFLHVVVDVEFTDGQNSYWTAMPSAGLAPLNYAQRYDHRFEHNAIRSGELVYIDHPLLGILIRITPAPEPAETRQSTAPGQPAP